MSRVLLRVKDRNLQSSIQKCHVIKQWFNEEPAHRVMDQKIMAKALTYNEVIVEVDCGLVEKADYYFYFDNYGVRAINYDLQVAIQWASDNNVQIIEEERPQGDTIMYFAANGLPYDFSVGLHKLFETATKGVKFDPCVKTLGEQWDDVEILLDVVSSMATEAAGEKYEARTYNDKLILERAKEE